MSRYPDDLHHTTEALKAVNEAILNMGVPLFGLQARWDELLVSSSSADRHEMGEVEIHLDRAREAEAGLKAAHTALLALKKRLS